MKSNIISSLVIFRYVHKNFCTCFLIIIKIFIRFARENWLLKFPGFNNVKNMKHKMKKMMTGRKISTSEDVYITLAQAHTQIFYDITHSQSFACVQTDVFSARVQ